jgi:hypothetical protein
LKLLNPQQLGLLNFFQKVNGHSSVRGMRATAMTTVTRSDSDRPPRADVNNVEARHEDDKENGAVNTAGVKRSH